MLTFEDFKKMAMDTNLKPYEKVGFSDCHRENSEDSIFTDICDKLSLSNSDVNGSGGG